MIVRLCSEYFWIIWFSSISELADKYYCNGNLTLGDSVSWTCKLFSLSENKLGFPLFFFDEDTSTREIFVFFTCTLLFLFVLVEIYWAELGPTGDAFLERDFLGVATMTSWANSKSISSVFVSLLITWLSYRYALILVEFLLSIWSMPISSTMPEGWFDYLEKYSWCSFL